MQRGDVVTFHKFDKGCWCNVEASNSVDFKFVCKMDVYEELKIAVESVGASRWCQPEPFNSLYWLEPVQGAEELAVFSH